LAEYNVGEDVAASEHGFANGHELCCRVISIADELGVVVSARLERIRICIYITSCRFEDINAYTPLAPLDKLIFV
jgi:hypothetical protein